MAEHQTAMQRRDTCIGEAEAQRTVFRRWLIGAGRSPAKESENQQRQEGGGTSGQPVPEA
jgi:hypothetical protein